MQSAIHHATQHNTALYSTTTIIIAIAVFCLYIHTYIYVCLYMFLHLFGYYWACLLADSRTGWQQLISWLPIRLLGLPVCLRLSTPAALLDLRHRYWHRRRRSCVRRRWHWRSPTVGLLYETAEFGVSFGSLPRSLTDVSARERSGVYSRKSKVITKQINNRREAKNIKKQLCVQKKKLYGSVE